MKKKVLVFLAFLFLNENIDATTIVAKINPKDNSLYLDERDKNRDIIMAIIQKYEWPLSLIHCTDQEREEVFKNNIPFAETVYIQDQIRKQTGDNSYITLWIPTTFDQAFAWSLIYNNGLVRSLGSEVLEKIDTINKKIEFFFLPNKHKIIYQNLPLTFDREHIDKNLFLKIKKLNECIYTKVDSDAGPSYDKIPYFWKHFCCILKFLCQKNLLDKRSHTLALQKSIYIGSIDPNENKAISLLAKFIIVWIRNSLPKKLHAHTERLYELTKQIMQKEYAADLENRTLFSRTSDYFSITEQDIRNEIKRYDGEVKNIKSEISEKKYHKYFRKNISEKIFQFITNLADKIRHYFNEKKIETFNVLYVPNFKSEEKKGELGSELYSASFSVRHFDELDHGGGCSFTSALDYNEPLFHFSVPKKLSLYELRVNRGIVIQPVDARIATFLNSPFTHGRLIIPYHETKEYLLKKLNYIVGVHNWRKMYNYNAFFKYYSLPPLSLQFFDTDSFDVISSSEKFSESLKEKIITNQKQLPSIYEKLLVERIKELSKNSDLKELSDPVLEKIPNTLPSRLSAISAHLKA